MENGKIQVYIGDGKGKTTAAFGLALRCYGVGGNVLVLQYLKTWKTGEIEAVKALDEHRFQVMRFESEHDLVFDDPTELDFEYLQKDILKAYLFSKDAVASGKWDLVVLDEILWAHYFKFLSAGCSDFSTNILKNAGVDLETDEPYNLAFNEFENIINQMEELINQ